MLITVNINGSISSVMLPTLSSEQDNKVKLKQMMRRAIKISAFLLFPMMFGLAAISEPLVRIILTDKWLPVVPLMQILCFSYVLAPIHIVNLQAISAIGRSDIFLKIEIIKKTVVIMGLVLSIPFGISAMAIMQVITSLLAVFINAYPNKKLLNYSAKEQIKDILPPFIISCVMAIIVYMINLLNINLIFKLIFQIIIGIVFYFTTAYVLKMESFTYIIDSIKIKRQGGIE